MLPNWHSMMLSWHSVMAVAVFKLYVIEKLWWTLISLMRTTSSNRKHNLSKTTKQWIINRSRIRSTSNFKICAGTLGSPSWFLAQLWAFEPALLKLLFKSAWSLSSVWTILIFCFRSACAVQRQCSDFLELVDGWTSCKSVIASDITLFLLYGTIIFWK